MIEKTLFYHEKLRRIAINVMKQKAETPKQEYITNEKINEYLKRPTFIGQFGVVEKPKKKYFIKEN
ncbi:hypothetical protein [Cytobacillus gottheilii]|uniref:hypothetical protein n=1 Tax=Cytobacillus gottheilii TaxID=859144 RepID=UPI001C585763|nr:hypothetical protein [Cytobacillus gottheilii]